MVLTHKHLNAVKNLKSKSSSNLNRSRARVPAAYTHDILDISKAALLSTTSDVLTQTNADTREQTELNRKSRMSHQQTNNL